MEMDHRQFVSAYRRGEIRVDLDTKAAERLLAARLLLPLVAMPVLGIGVALALIGWVFTGLALIAVGYAGPKLIRRSAPHFLMQQALQDPALYDELRRSGILRVQPAPPETAGD